MNHLNRSSLSRRGRRNGRCGVALLRCSVAALFKNVLRVARSAQQVQNFVLRVACCGAATWSKIDVALFRRCVSEFFIIQLF